MAAGREKRSPPAATGHCERKPRSHGSARRPGWPAGRGSLTGCWWGAESERATPRRTWGARQTERALAYGPRPLPRAPAPRTGTPCSPRRTLTRAPFAAAPRGPSRPQRARTYRRRAPPVDGRVPGGGEHGGRTPEARLAAPTEHTGPRKRNGRAADTERRRVRRGRRTRPGQHTAHSPRTLDAQHAGHTRTHTQHARPTPHALHTHPRPWSPSSRSVSIPASFRSTWGHPHLLSSRWKGAPAPAALPTPPVAPRGGPWTLRCGRRGAAGEPGGAVSAQSGGTSPRAQPGAFSSQCWGGRFSSVPAWRPPGTAAGFQTHLLSSPRSGCRQREGPLCPCGLP